MTDSSAASSTASGSGPCAGSAAGSCAASLPHRRASRLRSTATPLISTARSRASHPALADDAASHSAYTWAVEA
ncbi:hypothetical protein [Pseudonocardia xishanensis]|uniref:hypothetical protein n=1 Tax=Pseudonocardia xishanensis TaxID=630995 RepID=UPI0031EDB66E